MTYFRTLTLSPPPDFLELNIRKQKVPKCFNQTSLAHGRANQMLFVAKCFGQRISRQKWNVFVFSSVSTL